MIRKWSNLIVYMEKVSVTRIEDQNCYKIPLNHNLNKSKPLALFNSIKAERSEKVAEGKFEANRG